MTEKAKNLLSFLGRFALSAGLLVWIFRSVDWKHTFQALRMANGWLLAGAFVTILLVNGICLVRWYIFMRALSLKAPAGEVVRYFFIGLFCNLFLPTSIGGDVIKAMGLSSSIGQKAKVVASILLDRLSGFGGLVVLALAAYVFGSAVIAAPAVIVPVLTLTALSLMVGFMLFHDEVYEWCCRIFKVVPRLHKALMEMHADVVLMKRRKRTALGCVALSLIVQVLGAYMYFLISLALGQKAGLLYFLIVSPIVSAITFLPSIGGLGVREFGWAYFLGHVGVDRGIAIGISLVSFLFVIITGVIGGVFYVTSVSARRIQSAPADAGLKSADA